MKTNTLKNISNKNKKQTDWVVQSTACTFLSVYF